MTDRVNRKAMLIGVGCMFFQQASGINLVIFFMNSIFGKASGGGGGVDKMSNETSSIIIAVIQVRLGYLPLYTVGDIEDFLSFIPPPKGVNLSYYIYNI